MPNICLGLYGPPSWTHSDSVPDRGNGPSFPRGPMSSTEASSVSVTHMQLKSRWGGGAEVCALAKKCHALWCRCDPKTIGQVPSDGGGEGFIRNQQGRAEASLLINWRCQGFPQWSAWNTSKKPHECAFKTDWPGMTFTQVKSGPGYHGICSEEPQEDSSVGPGSVFRV